jgi:hypothetical protein
MEEQSQGLERRKFLQRAAIVGLAASGIALGAGAKTASAGGRFPGVHGVCWLGGKDCKVTYVDLGPTKKGNTPIYAFPSSDNNPLDTGGNYRPQRLQNNAFAGSGRYWPMFEVVSASLDLFASTDGTKTIYSTVRAPAGSPSRDLTTNPFKSEGEVLAARDRGEVTISFTGVNIDCPITDAAAGDIVVDLNPTVGPFCSRSA